jgi:hypothetical protein
MEEVIKSWLSVFLLLITVIVGTSYLGTTIVARNANACMQNYVQRIEASHGSQTVLDDVVAEANEKFGKTDAGKDALDVSKVKHSNDYLYGTVSLTYHYTIPIFGIDEEKVIQSDVN